MDPHIVIGRIARSTADFIHQRARARLHRPQPRGRRAAGERDGEKERFLGRGVTNHNLNES